MFGLVLMVLVGQLSMSDTLWTEETEGYKIEVFFPEIVLENEYVRNTLQNCAMVQVKNFKKAFRTYQAYGPVSTEWVMTLNFMHKPSPDGMACIVAWQWEHTGGAHGNSFTHSINFNLLDSSLIGTLELLGGEMEFELFASSVVAKLCKTEADKTWIERGASADIQNYHTVFPVPSENGGIKGYTVLFPPYQVACYGAGIVEVFIPIQQVQAE